ARCPPAPLRTTGPLTAGPPTWLRRPPFTATRRRSPGRLPSSPSVRWPRGCYCRAAWRSSRRTVPPNWSSLTEASQTHYGPRDGYGRRAAMAFHPHSGRAALARWGVRELLRAALDGVEHGAAPAVGYLV